MADDYPNEIFIKREYPPRRSGHISINMEHLILIWGGYKERFNGMNKFISGRDIWFYNCETTKWTGITVPGYSPNCKSGASAAYVKDCLYLFGGFEVNGSVNNLFKLHMPSLQWTHLRPSGTQPMAVDKAVGWTYCGKFYVFGGYGINSGDLVFHHNFHFVHHEFNRGWTDQFFEYDPETNQWNMPAFSGLLPSGRAAHAAAILNGKVYIFGGRHLNNRLNDLYCIDMEKMEWRQIVYDTGGGSVPQGRSWHSLTACNERFLVLYGGLSQNREPLGDCWLFDTLTEKWLKRNQSCEKPRIWHSAVLNSFGEILIHGGSTENIVYNVLHDASTRSPSQVNDIITLIITPKSLYRSCVEAIENLPLLLTLLNELPMEIQKTFHQRAKMPLCL